MLKEVDSSHPPGVVAITSGELTRFADFSISMLKLRVPRGSRFVWTRGVGIAGNLNSAVRQSLAFTDPPASWIWLMGDDHVFDSDLLLHLLARQVDVVAPLCSYRTPPFRGHIYTRTSGPIPYENRPWSDVPSTGLHKVDGANSAGMLIRRDVWETLKDPWFEVGRTAPDALGEDLYLCTKMVDAGYSVWLDCDHRIGHQTTVTIWPCPEERGSVVDCGKGITFSVSFEGGSECSTTS